MIFQTNPDGGEVLLLLLHFFEKSLRAQLYFSIWRVLQLPVGKEKKLVLAWFEKLNLAGNTMGTEEL